MIGPIELLKSRSNSRGTACQYKNFSLLFAYYCCCFINSLEFGAVGFFMLDMVGARFLVRVSRG